jgi:arylsulfatase A-like enzyme
MKPNIVILMTDQQRADLRKSQGYSLDTMPFLDSWAEGGADFARAYTPNPTCMPARVSMFTGRYPESHRVRTNHNAEDALYTEDLPDLLKKAGYATALCGKNHSHRKPEDFDFAETNGHLGHEGNRKTRNEQEEAFARFMDATRHMEIHSPSPGGVEMQHPYRNVSSAFSFLDGRPRDKPFFLWLSFAEPHNPYQVPEPYFDLFPPEELPPVKGPEVLKEKGHKFLWLRDTWEQVLGPDIDRRILRARSNYHGMLRLIDDQFKRFIGGLESRGLGENTLVLFLSDHGDFAGEYGLIRKGPELPELLTRVPFVWRGPGIKARGRVGQGCVNIVDIFPTICEMIGREIPFGVQGKSILPLLEGEDVPEKEFEAAYSESGFGGLYWDEKDTLDPVKEGAGKALSAEGRPETFDCLNSWTQCGELRMLRKGSYKIQVDMLGAGYLYDLDADPLELHNLFDDAAYLAVKADMLGELTAAILRACDPLPPPRRRYRVKVQPRGYWFQEYHC